MRPKSATPTSTLQAAWMTSTLDEMIRPAATRCGDVSEDTDADDATHIVKIHYYDTSSLDDKCSRRYDTTIPPVRKNPHTLTRRPCFGSCNATVGRPCFGSCNATVGPRGSSEGQAKEGKKTEGGNKKLATRSIAGAERRPPPLAL